METDLIHSQIMRAMVVSQIGEGCPFHTIKAAADHYGVHPEQLRMYVRGLRQELEPKMMAAMGVEKVVFYRPVASAALASNNTKDTKEGE
ncbi:hypothetical protein [Novosphingobium mathurense]|uniref:Uncharacterized protein n=1 Tax=Novosphingobium mathurense TaxID=428990 RepID=A0A1U6I6Q0_9SPHN|nr:hypothetical protein [Novosphingobium mathurense]SLK03662.1 hypothetical protein SAMN06295987_104274 [Novosphingobium mathurense]